MNESGLVTELERKIHILRTKMISAAQLLGLHHPLTIKYSQQLDVVLDDLQRLKLTEYLQ